MVTVNDIISGLQHLKNRLHEAKEFSGQEYNSMRSIFIQIDQNSLLSAEQKKKIWIEMLVNIEENLINEIARNI